MAGRPAGVMELAPRAPGGANTMTARPRCGIGRLGARAKYWI
jgi:hypothetical protein